MNAGTASNPIYKIDLYRVRLHSYLCNELNPTPVPVGSSEASKLTGVHFLPKQMDFQAAMDALKNYYGIPSYYKSRYWLKGADDDDTKGLESKKIRNARILSADVTDADENNWKFIRYPIKAPIESLLGNREELQVIIECSGSIDPIDSRWPRASILNRWKENLREGDILDAMDTFKTWFTAQVLEVGTNQESIRIKYLSWSANFEEKIMRSDFPKRIKPAFTESFNRFLWKEGDVVEFRIGESSDDASAKHIWIPATITAVNTIEEKVQVVFDLAAKMRTLKKYSVVPKTSSMSDDDAYKKSIQPSTQPVDSKDKVTAWVDILGDDVSPLHTHIKPKESTPVDPPTNFTSNQTQLSKVYAKPVTSYYDRYDYGEKHTRGEPPAPGTLSLYIHISLSHSFSLL